MEIIKIKPFGFCSGVDKAIKVAVEAKEENPNTPVYLLGMLVHNEEVIEYLTSKGLLILDEKGTTLDALINQIPDHSVLVFSAHGHASYLEEIAKKKKLKIYDATCTFVKENMRLGKENKDIIYIGVEKHLESEAFIEENPNACFYNLKTNKCDYSKIKVDNPKIISQTTISKLELSTAFDNILKKFPNCEILAERCSSTTLRQKAILDLNEDVDCLIVLGSKTSNNSKKLAELGEFKKIKTILALDLNEIKSLDFEGIKKAALASGASTSRDTFNQVAAYLESLN